VEIFLLTQALFFKIILTILLLVKCGKYRRKRSTQCMHVCVHVEVDVCPELAFYESPEISALILNKGLGRFIFLLNCSSKSFT